MGGALETLARQPTYQQPAYQPAYQPPPAADVNETDFADVRTVRRVVQDTVGQAGGAIGQQMQGLYQMQAQTNLGLLRDKHGDAFRRYGHEIHAKLATIPANLWTLDNLRTVVKMVEADHIDELALDRAREMMAQQDPALRPTGSTGGYPQFQAAPGRIVESEALPSDYRDLLRAKGVTDEAVREFCARTGQTVDQWVEMAKRTRTDVITERSVRRDGLSQPAPIPQAPPR